MDNAKQHYAPASEGLLAPIKAWFKDPDVSEIMINRPGEVYIEKKGTMFREDVPVYNERMLTNLFQLIANENKQTLNARQPLLSGSLLDGSRVQLVLPPTAKHLTLSVRRKVVNNLTLDDYVEQGYYREMMPYDIHASSFAMLPDTEKALVELFHQRNWATFLERAIDLRKNIVISGSTSSGKTTYLNACLRRISTQDRLLILEDTREIDIPHPNQVNLLAPKDDQGIAKVTMQDLVRCCLRLRPDRIIMGEIRGKEIMDFVSACSTGHEGSLTTIHANNPRIAFMRMTQMYKQNNVPSMTDDDIMRELKEVVDVIIQVHKTPDGRLAHSLYYKHMNIVPDGLSVIKSKANKTNKINLEECCDGIK